MKLLGSRFSPGPPESSWDEEKGAKYNCHFMLQYITVGWIDVSEKGMQKLEITYVLQHPLQ